MRGKFDMYFMKSIISPPPGEQLKRPSLTIPLYDKLYVRGRENSEDTIETKVKESRQRNDPK